MRHIQTVVTNHKTKICDKLSYNNISAIDCDANEISYKCLELNIMLK